MPSATIKIEGEIPEFIRYCQVMASHGGADKYGVRHAIFDLRQADYDLWPQVRKLRRVILVYQAKS